MFKAAKWVWDSEKTVGEWNYYTAFRKPFVLNSTPSKADLYITADSQYWVWVNGKRVGSGPIRSFPNPWYYDSYDIRNYLKPGDNEILILAHAIGVGTFRYIPAPSGVIAEIQADGKPIIGTDSSWECSPRPFGTLKEFRISCQQGWLEPPGSPLPELIHSCFAKKTTPAVEVTQNRELIKAPLSIADTGIVSGVSIARSAVVKPPETTINLSLRRFLFPNILDASPREVFGLVGFLFHVKHSRELIFEFPAPWFWMGAKGRLNGVEMTKIPTRHSSLGNGTALIGQAQPGENFIVFDVSGTSHEWTLQTTVDDVALQIPGPFYVLGPFDSAEAVQSAYSISDFETFTNHPLAKIVPSDSPCVDFAPAFSRTAFAKLISPEPIPQHPDEIRLGNPGEGECQIILDLGRMTVGRWAFEAEADEDTEVFFNEFEGFQNGEPDFCWEMSNTWIVNVPKGTFAFESLHRRGGRFVVIQGKDVCIRNFRVIESTYPCKPIAVFQSSEEKLNKIFEMCALTSKLCSEDTFVDCPTYEQTFWVGDARIEALVNYAVFGDYPLARRCLELAGESLTRSPLVESHVPSAWPVIIPAWSFLWAIACFEHYWFTGDTEFLRKIYPRMLLQAKNAAKHLNDRNLFEMDAWNLTDWAPMDQPHKGVVTANQGWLCWALDSTAKAATVLEEHKDAEWCKEVSHLISEASNEFLWNDEKGAFTDCLKPSGEQSDVFSVQTQCVLALANMPKPERMSRIQEILTGKASESFVQPGTPFFYFFLFEYLEKIKENERILEVIREKWSFMLDKGATTCWELFPGYLSAGRWTRSQCHAWSAGPGYFLKGKQFGIVPISPGFSKVLFCPYPIGLSKVSGSYPTPKGAISVEWEYKDDEFRYSLTAPEGIEVVTDLSNV
ncbi:MAG TPA: alpha-L-rhamnosidase C-terminal domain-containing protein [Fimbriimonadales bacterium]|nr:alpha-L-rhamnosidase C-terminal domain-containing protein [Fimbriimonadales bacterium]